jgi:uncharacterized protein
MTDAVTVTADELFLYPIKSCAALAVQALAFDAQGHLLGDREWAIVDERSSLVWQGSHPGLARLRPSVADGQLSMHCSGTGTGLRVAGAARSSCTVQIWNDSLQQHECFEAQDEGDEAAAFLRQSVGAELRLVHLGPAALRRPGTERVHIVSRSSCDELAGAVAQDGPAFRANLERFRPNIVITGSPGALMPFLEEHFTHLEWQGGSRPSCLTVIEPCVRCIVPNVDPPNRATLTSAC